MHKVREFLGCRKGSVSIETLFWLPTIVFAMCLIFDAATVFHRYPQIARVLQDGHRHLSTGGLPDAASTEAYVKLELRSISPNVSVETSINSGIAYSEVTVPAGDLRLIGMFQSIVGSDLKVTGAHRIEDASV